MFKIHKHLSPNTAKNYGFELVGDVRMRDMNPNKGLDDDVIWLLKEGFRLGLPTVPAELPEFVGLYRPNIGISQFG